MINGFIAALLTILFLRFAFRKFYRFPNRTEHDVASFLAPVDLGELMDLVDALTEEIMWHELEPRELRKVQLKRLRLLLEYSHRMRHNANVLQEWGAYGYRRRRYAQEDGIKSCSLGLVKACRHFHFGARSVQFDLHVKFVKLKLFPTGPVPRLSRVRRIDASFDLLFAYQSIRIAAEYLSQAYGEDCYQSLAKTL
ncbi:MAG TPA: hypothetical protein VNV88_16445 [Candidatus Solibacter sp.]|jgi:hypothetical protein|nr:hypothetical protein [Candidatus Solibacter sp.]